jgi:hypothetical protein
MLSRLLGANAGYSLMDPFGYINATHLVGVGNCNNPFYENAAALPDPADRVPMVGADDVMPHRTGFGNHAFVEQGGDVYDATAGPHLGTEDLEAYANSSIDISTMVERYLSPDTSLNGVISAGEATAARSAGNVTDFE